MESLVIGISGVVVLMAGWALVQTGWRKAFSDQISDSDVLAHRSKCGNCGCTTICQKQENDIEQKIYK